MKDLIIEYRDGKLAELRIDGVLLEGVTSLGFSHFVGKETPELTVNLVMNGKESLIPSSHDSKALESHMQRYSDAEAVVVLTRQQDVSKAVQQAIAKQLKQEVQPGGLLSRK
ncbi:hypothetical protein QMS90_16020 [Cronobacter sakazakii]|uniref:hypothetical protein n=1 Tax=Cronobacter sakazakii TaxID=28141 RepID=UPI000A11C8EF|nr:hypothetical protein [Cronobacter sakazakii]EGT4367368.1 hypothetical protein [Cronobacter sakazakii]